MPATQTATKSIAFTHPTRMTRKAGTDHRHYAAVTKRVGNRRGYVVSMIVDKVCIFEKSFESQGDAFEWLQRDGFTRDR